MKNDHRLHFAHLPTPIERLPRLTEALHGPNILVKRDDQTGLAFGGNKTRKLEFLLADAQAQGARTLITTGAIQSNHCRQTAAAAARFGFSCILVLVGDPPRQPSANTLLDLLFGAEIVWTGQRERDQVLQGTFEELRSQGKQPYLVPYGGSSPVGALAYAHAMHEFMDQRCEADWIVFATSSGGTQAGLTLGSRVYGYRGKVLGISVDESEDMLKERVARLATEASMLIRKSATFFPEDVLVNADYCAPGYGVLTERERNAIQLFARYEGLLLDPVYTGRAAAGLVDLIQKGYFLKDQTILFWHTGGQPALFADKYQKELV